MELQFWDTSAVVALFAEESRSPDAMRIAKAGNRFWAWEWMQVESLSALIRRRMGADHIRRLQELWRRFEYVNVGTEHFPALGKMLRKYRLRSADAGHLLCLKWAHRLDPDIGFVCFDQELADAAKSEGIRVIS
jgi:predicted nucleic acid-binding protein